MSQPVTRCCWRMLTRITLRGADPTQHHGQPHVLRGAPTGKLERPVQLIREDAYSMRRIIRSGSDLLRASQLHECPGFQ